MNDCLPILEKNRIISAIKREVGLQRLNIRYRALQLDFNEVEKRHQAIMDASSSPLAYIQEGYTYIVMKVMLNYFPILVLKKSNKVFF